MPYPARMGATQENRRLCLLCGQAAVRTVYLPDLATGQHRPNVYVCSSHAQLLDAGVWTVGWCQSGLHAGSRSAMCEVHGVWFV